MIQRVFRVGLLGWVTLLSGCGSRPTEVSNASNAAMTAEAAPATEGNGTAVASNSKQIRLSVSGMT